MFRTMFARVFGVFLALIITMLLIFSWYSSSTIRNVMINDKLDMLKEEAREIAYLSANVESNVFNYFNLDTPTNDYLQHKIESVQDKFGAYILVVDGTGKVRDNYLTMLEDSIAFAKALNANEVAQSLIKILSGQEITSKSLINGSPVFTVGVPFVKDDTVQGAVFIHTKSQKIEAGYRDITIRMLSIFIVAVIFALIVAYMLSKKLVEPLKSIENAVSEMASGNFNRRAEETGSIETERLSHSFNFMAEQLAKTEESRKEFVANVSHELRSPVTSIHGYVSGMLDGTIPKDQTHRYLEIVNSETNRLSKLISDLLNLSRLEKDVYKLNYESFDINETIRRILIGRMQDIENKQLDIDMHFENEQCFVYADKDRIYQVLFNLLDNTLKFTPEKGLVTFGTKTFKDKVFVNISDNGIGISKTDAPYIFDRFYKQDKSHSTGKGTGLGLSICKQIMDLHGETIKLLPSITGASFEFSLKASSSQIAYGTEK